MKTYIITLYSLLLSLSVGCQDLNLALVNIDNNLRISSTPISSIPFVGIGPQWGGYDNIKSWTGSDTFNEGDWNVLKERVSFMSPGLVRIMAAQGWNYYRDGVYNPEISAGVLFRILDFCEENDIQVMYGEWGEKPIGTNQVDVAWLQRSTDFLKYLLETKKYTCLKYYNMCNEPAGSWSSIAGNYQLWQDTYDVIFDLMAQKGLMNKIEVIAPDVAIWNDNSLINWITRPASYFGDKIDAYDIHSYPTDDQVKGGNYSTVLKQYRAVVPQGKAMIMGELGFKYNANSANGAENLRRIAADPFAGDDSNMLMYDAFYGVDVADAVIQNMIAGYNGVILWNMDDAMYNDTGDKLKKWGFWNILGTEKFQNVEDEKIRPWFYPISLLCRYFPVGSTIYPIHITQKKGLNAISAVKNGKRTIAIVNSHATTYNLTMDADSDINMVDAKLYSYRSGKGASFDGAVDAKGFAKPAGTENLQIGQNKKYDIQVPGNSFILITTM